MWLTDKIYRIAYQGLPRVVSRTTDPTVNDDVTQGFKPLRSKIYNNVTGTIWLCKDSTEGAAQWEQTNLEVDDLHAVAVSGDYNDLSNTPALATVATSGDYNDLSNTPTLATVATSGDYNDLSGAPVLADVATSGQLRDLTDISALAAAPGSGQNGYVLKWDNAASKYDLAQVDYTEIANTPALATVATSGDYSDLSGTIEGVNIGLVTPARANFSGSGVNEAVRISGTYTNQARLFLENTHASGNNYSISAGAQGVSNEDFSIYDETSGAIVLQYDKSATRWLYSGDLSATELNGQNSAYYLDRANHTGTQTLSTISDAGTIAAQNSNNISITGGNLDGVAIGASTASTIRATTLNVVRTTAPTAGTSEVFNFQQSVTSSLADYVIGRWITASGGNLALRVSNLNEANPAWQFNAGGSEEIKFAQGATDRLKIGTTGAVTISNIATSTVSELVTVDTTGKLAKASISTATLATDDKVIIQDTSASDALKTVTAQSIVDLAVNNSDIQGEIQEVVGSTSSTETLDFTVEEDALYELWEFQYTDGSNFIVRKDSALMRGSSSSSISLISSSVSGTYVNKSTSRVGSTTFRISYTGLSATAKTIRLILKKITSL